MARATDIKKSDFTAVTESVATDYFDLVRSGQNFKISQADLITSFGVSGTIQALGEVTATPILSKVSTINYIRNLFAGAGIGLSLTAQGSIKVAHNFLVDSTGVPLITDVTLAQPKVKSLQAGSGITIATAGEVIQIATAAVPGSTKTVYVYQEADFPTAILGVITLAADTEYRVQTDITTTSRFVLSENTILTGPDEGLITLSYTGVGTMFTAVDAGDNSISGMTISCASGTAFDISSTDQTDSFNFTNADLACATVGTMTGLNICYFRDFQITATTQGLAFSGDFNFLFISTGLSNTVTAAGAKAFDLGSATFDFLHIGLTAFVLEGATSYCISGLVDSGNINADGFATVFRCQQLGAGTFLENISPYDDLWEFVLNANTVNSTNLALATHGGATITIASAATPVIIGATWVSEDMHRFTHTVGGRWTYTGKGAQVDITASISADLATGVDDVSFFIYHNGVQITESRITREFDAGNIGNLSLLWALDLATDDYIELWVQNDDTSVNVIIENIVLRISG